MVYLEHRYQTGDDRFPLGRTDIDKINGVNSFLEGRLDELWEKNIISKDAIVLDPKFNREDRMKIELSIFNIRSMILMYQYNQYPDFKKHP